MFKKKKKQFDNVKIQNCSLRSRYTNTHLYYRKGWKTLPTTLLWDGTLWKMDPLCGWKLQYMNCEEEKKRP